MARFTFSRTELVKMANLDSWQKITRVLPGLPFGDGVDGAYSSATIPTMTYRSCSGSSGSTTLTLGSAGFSNGDLILIHQTRGTGAGQWEINQVVSGGGTASLTLLKALQYTYTDSGASQAQAVKILRYTDVTVPSGATWAVPGWDGNTGGIFVLAAKGTVTVTGTIYNKGSDGATSGGGGAWVYPSDGGGFKGGGARDGINSFGYQGESPTGAGTQSSSANGGGGGAGGGNALYNAGGGGGHATAGTSGSGSGSTNGTGGGTYGTSDLTTIFFGSGGGGATGTANSTVVSGANGGGIIILIAKTFSISGSINVKGGTHNVTNYRETGGGGAGGSCLLVAKDATLGTNLVDATSDPTIDNSQPEQSGDGGSGRIALHYSGTYSGSTNPTLYANQDPSLVEAAGGAFLFNFL